MSEDTLEGLEVLARGPEYVAVSKPAGLRSTPALDTTAAEPERKRKRHLARRAPSYPWILTRWMSNASSCATSCAPKPRRQSASSLAA